MEVLALYLTRAKGVVDEHQWWLNTMVPEDVAHIRDLTQRDPGFFRIVDHEGPGAVGTSHAVSDFYAKTADDNTVYIKVDDDIVWMAPDAILRLVEFRLRERQPFLVYANIVNNVICSFYHQKRGTLPRRTVGLLTRRPFCDVGWGSGHVAELIHRAFLEACDLGYADSFHIPDILLEDYIRTSINVIAWIGEDMREVVGAGRIKDDELLLSTLVPRKLGRANAICGDALVSHFAYYTQRPHLDRRPDLLEKYKEIALRPLA